MVSTEQCDLEGCLAAHVKVGPWEERSEYGLILMVWDSGIGRWRWGLSCGPFDLVEHW